MKALCNIVNLLAIVMVLLLGGVSVHAHENVHDHPHVLEAADGDDVVDHGVDLRVDSHFGGDTSMHCGAPILGPEPVNLGCTVDVAEVVYSHQGTVTVIDVSVRNLRPPRF